MIPVQNLYPIVALMAISATNGATITSQLIDTQGYHYANLTVLASTVPATNLPTVFKLQESNSTVATTFADIPAFVGGGASGFTIPAPQSATSTQPYALFNIDMRKRKRYLQFVYVPSTTQSLTVLAQLSRADQSPVGTTTPGNMNVAGIVVTG